MPLKKNTKKAIYIFTGFFVCFSILFALRYAFEDGGGKAVFQVGSESNQKQNAPFKQWKYMLGDKPQYALPTCKDSAWKTINPKLNFDSVSTDIFNGIIWFRCWFKVDDSLTKKLLALNVYHYGASEFYLDGKFLNGFGKVSTDIVYEKCNMPEAPVLFSLPDTNLHVLSIRYSNHKAIKFYETYEEDLGGVSIKLVSDAYKLINEKTENLGTAFIISCLFGFSFTLSIVHFLLYIFYRKQKENLYFAIFMLIYAFVVVKLFTTMVIFNSSFYLFYMYYANIFPLLSQLSLIACMYALFKPNHAKLLFRIGCGLVLFVILTEYIKLLNFLGLTAWFMVLIYTCIEAVRSILTGLRRKQEGAKIVGAGVLVFLGVVTCFFIGAAILSQASVHFSIRGIAGIAIGLFVLIAIMSIPLSMSIYLARNFAFTNKHLQDKLVEIESLSAKNILQEKEKQQILFSQNEMLERQVKERTYEVVKQKEIIEERNKDITDSIHYARRIQQALLASDNLLKQNLADYFIFFNPKDIVSGDFYWATRVNDVFYLVIADSTGHGVPGAFMSLLNMSFLNEAISEKKIQKPNEILAYVRNRLIESLKADGSEEGGKDGMDCTLIAFHAKTKLIEFSCANNPLILLRNYELLEYPTDRMPVGKSPRENEPFTLQTIQLQAGDTVYMFTDGYADQFGGPKGKKFKYKQLEELLLVNNRLSMQEQKAILVKQFETWKGELEQIDDVTLFAFKL